MQEKELDCAAFDLKVVLAMAVFLQIAPIVPSRAMEFLAFCRRSAGRSMSPWARTGMRTDAIAARARACGPSETRKYLGRPRSSGRPAPMDKAQRKGCTATPRHLDHDIGRDAADALPAVAAMGERRQVFGREHRRPGGSRAAIECDREEKSGTERHGRSRHCDGARFRRRAISSFRKNRPEAAAQTKKGGERSPPAVFPPVAMARFSMQPWPAPRSCSHRAGPS